MGEKAHSHMRSTDESIQIRHTGLPCGVGLSLAVFAALFIICMLFPYSGDDWAWGSSLGLERLKDGFAGYNGRYVGNLLVIVMTRSRILRAAIMAAILFAIPWCIDVIVGRNDSATFWIALVLLFAMPNNMRAQGIAWTSGFTNYAVPALFILLYFACFKGAFEEEYLPDNRLIIPLFLLGVVNALIMENVTLYNVFMSIVMLIYVRIKHGVWDKVQLAFLLGSVLGCIGMFSNSAYRSVAEGEDGYRSVNEGPLLQGMIYKFLFTINRYFCLNNLAVNLFVAFCGFSRFEKRKTAGSFLLSISTTIMAAMSFLSLTNIYSFDQEDAFPVRAIICAVAAGLFYCALLGMSVDAKRPLLGPAVVLSILALTAPLLVVNPIGPRNFLITYCLLILAACLAANECAVGEKQGGMGLVRYSACLLMLSWALLYGVIARADYARFKTVQKGIAQGSSTITVRELPCSNSIHCANPTEEIWATRFKLFYGIDENVEIVVEKPQA